MAFTLRLPVELEERLRRFCFDERLTKTDAVVFALEGLLDGRAAPAGSSELVVPVRSPEPPVEDLGIPLPPKKPKFDPDCWSAHRHREGRVCPRCGGEEE